MTGDCRDVCSPNRGRNGFVLLNGPGDRWKREKEVDTKGPLV